MTARESAALKQTAVAAAREGLLSVAKRSFDNKSGALELYG